jgi:hypothetical protein
MSRGANVEKDITNFYTIQLRSRQAGNLPRLATPTMRVGEGEPYSYPAVETVPRTVGYMQINNK